MEPSVWTVDKIKSEITYDDKIKVAGFDVDGILRGMYKSNLSISAWRVPC